MSNKIYITADKIESVTCDRHNQETAINWLRDDDIMEICSSDNTFITKMKRIMERDPNNYKCFYYEGNRDKQTGKLGNYFFEAPKSLLSFRSGDKKKRDKRELTEDERNAIRERFRKAREDKKNDSSV